MIYFIKSKGFVKIGYSSKPSRRIRTLQTGSPDTLKMLLTIPGDYSVENTLHKKFAKYRIRGEWFKLSWAIRWYIFKQKAILKRLI